jgi:lysophospholipase L1-like esterase
VKRIVDWIRSEKFYFIYLLILILITSYLSFLILTNNIQFKLSILGQFLEPFLKNNEIEIQKPFTESSELETNPMKCKPCEKVGVEPPRCPVNFMRKSNNTRLFYELIPNFEQIYDGNWICLPPTIIRINSYGFRDYEYSPEKPANTYRIIALGDSHTFGVGVNLTDSYPKILEQLLNEKNDSQKYEVLNFGIPGANLVEKIEFLKEKGLSFNPDLVILQWNTDDRINRTEWEKFIDNYIEKYLIEHNLSKEILDQYSYEEIRSEAETAYIIMKFTSDSEDRLRVELEEEFKELEEITQEKGIKVVILLFHTTLFLPSSNEKQILKDISSKYKWPVVDCDKYARIEYILDKNDSHPNQLGHKLIALEVYKKKLIESSIIPKN